MAFEGSIDETIWLLAEERMEEYEHKLADLTYQFADLQGATYELAGYDTCPPFSCRIRRSQLSTGFACSSWTHMMEPWIFLTTSRAIRLS